MVRIYFFIVCCIKGHGTAVPLHSSILAFSVAYSLLLTHYFLSVFLLFPDP